MGIVIIPSLLMLTLATGGTCTFPIESDTSWLAAKGFYERANWTAVALHLTRRDLRRRGRLTDHLRQVEGFRIGPSLNSGWQLWRELEAGEGPCQVSVYLNGGRLQRNPGGTLVDLDQIVSLNALDGLELYAGQHGPVYQEHGCGTLLLWSERRRWDIDQPFMGSVSGWVINETEDSVSSVVLQPLEITTQLDPEGKFEFPDLLPGRYRLEFYVGQRKIWSQRATVWAFKESLVEIEITRLVAVNGKGLG